MFDGFVVIIVAIGRVGASELVRAHVARMISTPHPAARRVLEPAQPNRIVPRPSLAES